MIDLFDSQSIPADANGEAEMTFSPQQAFKRWFIRRMTVSSDSATLVPLVKVYRGARTPTRLIDGSHTGTLDHSDTDLRLGTTDSLIFHFTNCDPGANCVAAIEGEVDYV